MPYQSFDLHLQGAVAHLQFNRPEQLNVMTADFWAEFGQAVRELDQSGQVRALVISSTGKHFSAGMDLKIFQSPDPQLFQGEPGRRAEAMRRLVLQLQEVFNALEQVRMPVLTAIQGGCIGGALDLVCASDMRYCSADAFFTVKETELGMTADLGTLQRLPRLIADGMARELIYSGRKCYAEEALRLGLVNQVFADHGSLLEGVLALAEQIASHSPLAITGCKQMLNYGRDHSVADSLKMMATWQAGMFHPNDMLQGFAAKMQGKAASYEDLRPLAPEPFKR
ncbi:crotonase/enoyl-CoA hydratase family protein [Balneatrix alpica]|uniref:crotonase/enoyl-CoA hydratase family protein n=1 Tax=Balneatrix alpica TaxID=75684 RepID=UPI0027383393|nr:crotonase/enoyl-CoA hydratase family protein [Balneatrix alpica]